MNTTIRKQKHLNLDAFVLENSRLQVTVLPDLGGKIASIRYRNDDFEFLHQPTKPSYDLPNFGSAFEAYDTSGLDDAFPTIDACLHPILKTDLPDHGEVWSSKVSATATENSLKTALSLQCLPLDFERTLTLEENRLTLSYVVTNRTDEDLPYLWALHGLNRWNEKTELFFSNPGPWINVMNGDRYSFDPLVPATYPEDSAFKIYFTNPQTKGQCGLYYPDQHLVYQINYDPIKLPYLGLWVTTGGFKGEINLAIEPTNGYYDRLDFSASNKKAAICPARSSEHWMLTITILKEDFHARTQI